SKRASRSKRSGGISVIASTPSHSSFQNRSGVSAPPGKRQPRPMMAMAPGGRLPRMLPLLPFAGTHGRAWLKSRKAHSLGEPRGGDWMLRSMVPGEPWSDARVLRSALGSVANLAARKHLGPVDLEPAVSQAEPGDRVGHEGTGGTAEATGAAVEFDDREG